MKKFNLCLMLVALILSAFIISGCTNSSDDNEQNNSNETVAQTLANQFKDEIEKDKNLEDVANNIAKNEIIKISLDVVTVGKEDYLSGFKTEIKGFKNAVAIRPFIGTIPFIAYIFEVENASDFAKNLTDNADLRWNVCTSADDLEVATSGDYVFIVMAPKNFDEE